MSDWHIYQGDVLDRLREMPDESVNCVVTSPPYWGLRDYKTATWDGGDEGCDHKRASQPRNERPLGSFHSGSDENNDSREPSYKGICGKCGAKRIDQQLGLEATPEEYVANMAGVFREVRREPCILAGCPEGGTVLDPFAGSGTTLMVALRHNRKAIGIELNPEYVELARARIRDDCPLFNTAAAGTDG